MVTVLYITTLVSRGEVEWGEEVGWGEEVIFLSSVDLYHNKTSSSINYNYYTCLVWLP